MTGRELEGKCALVTGGTRGIGKAVVFALAGMGASVAFSYRASAAEAEATGGNWRTLRFSITERLLNA